MLCLAFVAKAKDVEFPVIPAEAVDKYTVTQIDQRIESLDLPQMRATGQLLIFQMDPIADHSVARAPKGVSLRLAHYANPQLKVDLSSFKDEDFGYDLNADTLRRYLQGIEQGMTEEQGFEVLEEPTLSSGPARFRFLGMRSVPLRYRFLDGNADITRAENWFQIGDMIHVIAIQGPSRFYDSYFESVRVPFNSSVSVSN